MGKQEEDLKKMANGLVGLGCLLGLAGISLPFLIFLAAMVFKAIGG